jgi:hypothetical protein
MTPHSRTVDEDLISGAKKVEVCSFLFDSSFSCYYCSITALLIAPVSRASPLVAFIYGG